MKFHFYSLYPASVVFFCNKRTSRVCFLTEYITRVTDVIAISVTKLFISEWKSHMKSRKTILVNDGVRVECLNIEDIKNIAEMYSLVKRSFFNSDIVSYTYGMYQTDKTKAISLKFLLKGFDHLKAQKAFLALRRFTLD